MSKVKALDELREIAADINASEIVDHMKLYPSCVFDGAWLDAWHDEFYRAVDRLESEIAERYMELPVDADGVPIHVGDELHTTEHDGHGNVNVDFIVSGYTTMYSDGLGELMVTNDECTEFCACNCRHVKPRTIEDVLREFGKAYTYVDGECASTTTLIADYADELRSMGVGE